ncbi:MAG: hypothetical protein GX053_12695 [Tissierella sp.]|nr:hypothetical protein [Tissierella sp.]
MKKYDLVKVVDFYRDDKDKKYTEIGNELIGELAMVTNIDTKNVDYQIEIRFFDTELQELAISHGFDCWDESELEVI